MNLRRVAGEVHVEFSESMLLAAQAFLRAKNLPSLETAARALLRQWAQDGMARNAAQFLETLPAGTIIHRKALSEEK